MRRFLFYYKFVLPTNKKWNPDDQQHSDSVIQAKFAFKFWKTCATGNYREIVESY